MVNAGDTVLLLRYGLTNRNWEVWLNIAGASDFYGKDSGSHKIVIGKNMSFLKLQLLRCHWEKC